MSNDLSDLTRLSENATDVPVSAGQVENYVLLLVLLSAFAGGTLVLLSLLLLFCHRCYAHGRRYSRASDDPEKTNTTYAEDSQPTQEITIRLDESDGLSASSCHDGEPERFASTGSTGRRVSFNEAALYEQERTAQDKGRRYTLTEGDFHHLKKARLTHLHLPPSPCDLKILTIMECDSTESSTINISEPPAPKLPLTIYQPSERAPLDWMSQSLSGGLPGDRHHSIILDHSHRHASLATRSHTMEVIGDADSEGGMSRESSSAAGQTSVLHFFSKLRRHASLEGAGPYFKKWKFDSSQRAASLDAKGSPKRRPFQRQRAASETTDHTEDETSLPDNSFPNTPIQSGTLQSLSAESLSHPAPPVFLTSLKLEAMVEVGSSYMTRKEEPCSPTDMYHSWRHEESTGNGTDVLTEIKLGQHLDAVTRTEAAGLRFESLEFDYLFGSQQEALIQETFENIRKTYEANGKASDVQKNEIEVDEGDDVMLGAEAGCRSNSGSSLSFMVRQESTEAPPSLYREIWTLRASLEQYASSDQSSTDRESIRSDADSVSSLGGAGARPGLDSCLSQDLDDYAEVEGEGEVLEGGMRGAIGGDSEMGSGAGGEGDTGNRKLLQMDSGYASIEAPSKGPEEMRLFGAPGGPRGKTASERRLFFTNSGRKGSVCESTDAKLFLEELEDEMTDCAEMEEKVKKNAETSSQSVVLQEPLQLHKSQKSSQSVLPLQKPSSQPSSPSRPRLRRRDYSIDEKTDALFNEFLRHDPRFDQQDSPVRSRHRSRVHLRKQWQRHKQYSDPGSSAGGRYSPSLERQRFTLLRRGDSAGYPLDTRYHSTLSRIASAADEEASEVAACEDAAKDNAENKNQDSDGEAADVIKGGSICVAPTDEAEDSRASEDKDTEHEPTSGQSKFAISCLDPRVNRNNNSSQAILSEVRSSGDNSLTDKLVASVEERLYGRMRRAGHQLDQIEAEHVLTVSRTASPGYSPT